MKVKNPKTMADFQAKAGKIILSAFVSVCLALTIGCGSTKKSRYSLKHDKYPESTPNLSIVRNAEPKIEPKSRRGNPKSYVVLNKKYYVKPSSTGYKERGIASFYGKKFHGHETSNGEIYDMFSMTAAHKTLPIPTYVEVKNLNNGKRIIVRVNDRGPFHRDRIIDLSYAAAHKLGMLGRGTAKVEVKAINVHHWLARNKGYQNETVASVRKVKPSRVASNSLKLQVGAFSNKTNAIAFVDKVKSQIEHPVIIQEIIKNSKKLFKVTVGPIAKSENVEVIKSKLLAANINSVIVR